MVPSLEDTWEVDIVNTEELIATLANCSLDETLQQQRRDYLRAMPEVDVERAHLVTDLHRQANLLGCAVARIGILDKARIYRRVLESRAPIVRHRQAWEAGRANQNDREPPTSFAVKDRSPFAGSTTSCYKGVVLYPEFLALTLWPELRMLPRRKCNPYQISDQQADDLDRNVFPYWLDDSLMEVCRRTHPEAVEQLGLLEKLVFFMASKPNCISHTVPDFSRALGEGLRAIINDAQARSTEAPTEQQDFYRAIVHALEGIIAYSHRLAEEARRLAEKESDPAAKQELLDIAEIHDRIPEQPSRSFRDGLTAIWLCWIAVHLENANVGMSLGRLDQILYPLYQADVKAGTLTPAAAVNLVAHLWLKIGDHVPTVAAAGEQLFGGSGSNQAITIGGVDAEGRDAVNQLTYVMLRATEMMMMRDPNLNARYFPGVSDQRYLERLCQANIVTRATPALHNDAAVIKALLATGHSELEARDYAVIGCVEPGANGAFYGHSGAILVNLTAALEMALYDGCHPHTGLDPRDRVGEATGDVATFTSYSDFRDALKRQMTWLIDRAIRLNEALGQTHQTHYPTPILSALFKGPMESGRDVSQGGAKLNASGATIIGLADVADSLSAIEQVVFKGPNQISFAALRAELQSDFSDEALQKRLSNPSQTPKYGTGNAAADANARWLVETVHDLVRTRKNYRGGCYRAGYWTMTNHAGLGQFVGALPSGRKRGKSLASGITPVSGETPNLVPALTSVASLPARCLSNGIALNLKFIPNDGEEPTMVRRLCGYVKGYFDGQNRDGDMEIQFNVTDHAKFVEVAKNPEDPAYRDLLVRVSGYTAYFKDLAPRMKAEIIDRTEYRLSTGTAVTYPPFQLDQ